MSIEDYTRQREVMEMQSQGKVSKVGELLEQLYDMVVRLDREARLGVNCGH